MRSACGSPVFVPERQLRRAGLERPTRCQRQRRGRENRHLNVYAGRDNLRAWFPGCGKPRRRSASWARSGTSLLALEGFLLVSILLCASRLSDCLPHEAIRRSHNVVHRTLKAKLFRTIRGLTVAGTVLAGVATIMAFTASSPQAPLPRAAASHHRHPCPPAWRRCQRGTSCSWGLTVSAPELRLPALRRWRRLRTLYAAGHPVQQGRSASHHPLLQSQPEYQPA